MSGPGGSIDQTEFARYLADRCRTDAKEEARANANWTSAVELAAAQRAFGKTCFAWFQRVQKLAQEQQGYDATVAEVADRVAALFAKLDTNGNKVLNSAELEHAVGT